MKKICTCRIIRRYKKVQQYEKFNFLLLQDCCTFRSFYIDKLAIMKKTHTFKNSMQLYKGTTIRKAQFTPTSRLLYSYEFLSLQGMKWNEKKCTLKNSMQLHKGTTIQKAQFTPTSRLLYLYEFLSLQSIQW